MKIGVLGIGAIGTVVAYQLSTKPACQLYYYNRSERTALRLLLPNQQRIIKTIRCSVPQDGPILDWLFVCLKGYQIAAALPEIQTLIGKNTQVVVIRNGLNHQEDWRSVGLTDHLIPALIDCPTQLNTEGCYEQLRPAKLTAPESEAARSLANLIKPIQLELHLSKDFKTASWLKLTESAALGAITCLTGEGCWIFEDKRILDFYQSLLEETVRVALADGAHIPSNYVDELLVSVQQYPPRKTSSMLADRLAGNPIELSAKNGVIAELARKYQIATPLNDLVCTLLSKVNRPA